MARRRPSILTALRSHIPCDSKVLVAVSGGCDSIVLLDAVLRVRRMLGITVEVCHVDHALRRSSVDDAAFVSAACDGYGVPCHVVRLGSKPAGENMEAWARNERYRVLSDIRTGQGCDWVLTAHTASDVAETFLMRVVARKELGTIAEVDQRRRCLRPLLEASREEIYEYAARYGVRWVEDPSNEDTRIVRNRIRHTLIPLLRREFDPSITWIVAEQAASVAEDVAALRWMAEQVVTELGPLQEGSAEWTKRAEAVLAGLPGGLQWRVVELLMVPHVGYRVGERRAQAALRVVLGDERSLQLTKGVQFLRERNELCFVVR